MYYYKGTFLNKGCIFIIEENHYLVLNTIVIKLKRDSLIAE